MEEKLAELTAKVAELEQTATMLGTVDVEIFYWWCTALMVCIHAGFLAYEMGASRSKNVLASGVKNILAFAFIVPTFYFFGWWIYLAFPSGFIPSEAGNAGLPWDMAMGPNLADNASGVFWAAFVLFAATTASIFSGAVIERIRVPGFIILAILLGSVSWILAASWGWHPDGWLLKEWGYHDVGCAGLIHVVAGFFALGVLINLGPRVGKYNADGTANDLSPHNIPMVLIGLMLIIVGFFGFLGACLLFNSGAQWTNIYGQPATLSAYGFNTLMCFSGGIIGAWMTTRDPFWMMSGALAGIFVAAAGLDVWYPPLAFCLGFLGGVVIKPVNDWLTGLGIDDSVGAVAVHGFCGALGVMAVGIFATGYPNVGGAPPTSFMGQFVGLIVMILVGFIPGYVGSLILKSLGMLRVPDDAQELGLDLAEIPSKAYPEAGVGSRSGGLAVQPAE
ncbi:MAG: ammonium transporter [Pseudomonadota bacterium]